MPNTPKTSISRRVLVADDDPFYREIAIATLVDAGYAATAAADGHEALAALDAGKFDLAIIDVMMPGMTGLEVIERVRKSPATTHLPIIVITGNDDTSSVQEAFDVGATSFLAKPLNWPLFVHHVNFVLKANRAECDLRDAIRTAEFLSELKSRVVSMLVGEFQSPLRTAQGMTELLRKEVYGPLGHRIYLEYAEDLHKALDQLNTTQLRMMNSTRVMSTDLLLREEDVDLQEAILEAVQSSRGKADRRGIEIDLRDAMPPGIRLRCDRSLINQALKMLIEGAVQASHRNSTVSLSAAIGQDGAFVFSVEDTAPALSDVMMREVLDQAPAKHQSSQAVVLARNTGLTICRVLIEAHQGQMALRSAAELGTIVRLTLPTSRVSTGAIAAAPKLSDVRRLDPPSGPRALTTRDLPAGPSMPR